MDVKEYRETLHEDMSLAAQADFTCCYGISVVIG